jgi:23S rRNA pseudouridine2605 synthase
MSDPSRKPSRVRAAETAQADAVERRERPPKKEGWAKAAPRTGHPKKTFKPREGAPAAGERPARAYKPREGAPARSGDAAKREYKPRGFGAGSSGGRDTRPPRSGGGKPAGPSGTSGRGPGGKPRTPRS